MHKAWIFDFDGTIADSLNAAVDVFNTLAPEYGLTELTPEILPELRQLNLTKFLERMEVKHFDFISSCSKLKGKAKYLKGIARTFSLEPSEMIYVGDERRDIKAGRKAGVSTVGVCWGFNSAEALSSEEPKWLVSDPAQLGLIATGFNEQAPRHFRERDKSISPQNPAR